MQIFYKNPIAYNYIFLIYSILNNKLAISWNAFYSITKYYNLIYLVFDTKCYISA